MGGSFNMSSNSLKIFSSSNPDIIRMTPNIKGTVLSKTNQFCFECMPVKLPRNVPDTAYQTTIAEKWRGNPCALGV
jgi:hypothetical protein